MRRLRDGGWEIVDGSYRLWILVVKTVFGLVITDVKIAVLTTYRYTPGLVAVAKPSTYTHVKRFLSTSFIRMYLQKITGTETVLATTSTGPIISTTN